MSACKFTKYQAFTVDTKLEIRVSFSWGNNNILRHCKSHCTSNLRDAAIGWLDGLYD